MKKVISILAGIAVFAVLYFCFSVAYANYQIHKTFTDEASYFDRFGVKYELIEQQRGLFSSIYKTKLSTIISSNAVSSVTIESKAAFGVKSFDIFKIGSIYVTYNYDDTTKALLKSEYLINQNITMDIRFDGIEAVVKTKPQNFEAATDYHGKELIYNYNSGVSTQYIKSSFDAKTFVIKHHMENIVNDTRELALINVKDLTFDINFNRNKLNTWIGEVKIGAKNYNITAQGYRRLDTHITNYSVNIAANEQSDGLMSLGFKSGADEFKVLSDELNVTIKDILLDITISNLDQNGVGDIVNKLSKINLAMRDREKEIILSSAGVDAMQLLNTRPTINFNFAGSFNGSKINQISGYIQYTGDNAYSFNPSNWQKYLDFEFKYSIDKNMLVSLLQKNARERYKRTDLTSEEIEFLVEKTTQDTLNKLRSFGTDDINADVITGVFNKNTAASL
ncbi:MAG: YdgA family protein [Campylobacteraceae bacterium]|jgi:hypothetical protein|nr:YdgA family protein [Campylobacteraceae bacterium]